MVLSIFDTFYSGYNHETTLAKFYELFILILIE